MVKALSRDEWLLARRSGVGGSESPALFGEHPFLSAYALWLAKRHPEMVTDPDKEPDPLWWGRHLEPVIRARYVHESGAPVMHPPPDEPWLERHASESWLLASVDGLLANEFYYDEPWRSDGVFEAKSALFAGQRWEGETPPLYTQVQVQQYMAVLGLERAVIGVMLGYGRVRFFTLEKHERFQDHLRNVVGDWWHRHVVQGYEPPVDASKSTRRALAMRWPKPEPGKVVQLTGDHAVAAVELEHLKEQRRAFDLQISLRENMLRVAIGDANEARLPDGTGYRAIHINEATIPATTRRAYTKIQKVK